MIGQPVAAEQMDGEVAYRRLHKPGIKHKDTKGTTEAHPYRRHLGGSGSPLEAGGTEIVLLAARLLR